MKNFIIFQIKTDPLQSYLKFVAQKPRASEVSLVVNADASCFYITVYTSTLFECPLVKVQNSNGLSVCNYRCGTRLYKELSFIIEFSINVKQLFQWMMCEVSAT